MTNREEYKDILDDMLARIVAVVDGKPVRCGNASCGRCLFLSSCTKGENTKKVIDWLNAEYQEPGVDWSKVPIDTPVLVSDTEKNWCKRYFAGTDEDGVLLAFALGGTSWSSRGETESWAYMKLAEDNE